MALFSRYYHIKYTHCVPYAQSSRYHVEILNISLLKHSPVARMAMVQNDHSGIPQVRAAS